MANKQDIGSVFKEKLSGKEKLPDHKVWAGINADMEKRRKKKIGFYYFSIAVILGLIALIIASRKSFSEDDKSVDNEPIANEIEDTLVREANSETQTDTIFKNKKTKRTKTSVSKKLIRSDAEADEYEIVTRYNVIVKKERTTAVKTTKKTKNKIIGTARKTKKSTIVKKPPILKSGVKGKTYFRKKVKTSKAATRRISKSRVKKYSSKKSSDLIFEKNNDSKPSNEVSNSEVTSVTSSDLEDNSGEIPPLITSDSIKKNDSIKNDRKKKTLKEYKERIPQTEEKHDKVFFSVYAGPNYYNSFSKSSPIIKNGDDFEKKQTLNFIYGLNVRMMLSENFGFRAGIAKTTVKFSTEISNPGTNSWALANTNVNPENGIDRETFNANFAGAEKIELFQKIDYIEIPVEAYVAIAKKRQIGIDAFAGFSTFLLTSNTVSAKAPSKRTLDLSEAKNIKNISTSLNIGLVFYYSLNPKFDVNVSPVFKYALGAFSDSNFNPFFLSLQAGITYKP